MGVDNTSIAEPETCTKSWGTWWCSLMCLTKFHGFLGAFPWFPKCSGSKPRWPGNLNLQKPRRRWTSHFGEIPPYDNHVSSNRQNKSHSWTTLNYLVEHHYFFPIFSSKLTSVRCLVDSDMAPRLCEGRGRRSADPCLHGVHPCRRRGSEIRPGRGLDSDGAPGGKQKTHGFHPTWWTDFCCRFWMFWVNIIGCSSDFTWFSHEKWERDGQNRISQDLTWFS